MQTVDTIGERPKRPVFLLVLCILTFVRIGFGVMDGFLGLAAGPDSPQDLDKAQVELNKQIDEFEKQGMDDWVPTVKKLQNMVIVMNNNYYAVIALAFFIYAIGVTAAIMMLRGRKLGFHLYIIYTLLSVCDYYFFISPSMVPTVVIVLSALTGALFIGLYAINLKWMR